MLYFWVGLFTLMISIINYSVHMDAFLYMQKQKKIADEQAILEDVLTSSEYIRKIIVEDKDKDKCSDINTTCTELLQNRLESDGYTVNNNIMHCRYNGKIITYYNYNDELHDSVLSLYKKLGVQDLKTIDHAISSYCNLSPEGVYIQKEYKDN